MHVMLQALSWYMPVTWKSPRDYVARRAEIFSSDLIARHSHYSFVSAVSQLPIPKTVHVPHGDALYDPAVTTLLIMYPAPHSAIAIPLTRLKAELPCSLVAGVDKPLARTHE